MKRSASTSSDRSRPPKRQATSSPEEGELDDVSPAPRPATPPKSKIPFPFKRKPRDDSSEPLPHGETRNRPHVYERSHEDDRRFREDEERRWMHPRLTRHDSRTRGGDRWEPAVGRYESSMRSRWGYQDYHPREREQRDYPPRLPISPRRHASSRSPSSPRSRSPLSPTIDREKHRLPPPRKVSDSLLGGFYVDRERSRSRERRRYSPASRGHTPDDRTRQRAWDADGYDDDRYYRPQREERRRDRSSRFGDVDSYHPESPGALTPPRLLSPGSSSRHAPRGPITPPPPPTLPPPPPPETLLPTAHATIKIPLPLKKPASPINIHSPPPLTLSFAKTDVLGKESKPKREEREAKPAVQRQKRKPVVRTREEEAKVYGRMFVGCGKEEDYSVLTKLGEGTFGEVHKAVHRVKGNAVALKRILMHNEKEGMPVTALREIKILKALHHPCIVDILDMFVVKSQGKDSALSVYMVFPYMDHDLAGLLENERVKLSPSQIKLYMKQLLEGTEYMHRNHILHRDMKAANLLISNEGVLKVADFGLARAYDPSIVQFKEDARGKERKYTNCVVTRWYRPPELLLGARQYGGEVDMWGVGCVLGEMFWRRPILPGSSDLDQLDKIWQLCGTPTQQTWPNYDALPGCEGVKRFNIYPRRLKQVYDMIGPETVDLLDKLLTCNPRERITASKALDHDYFWTDPLPADPKTLPRYEASHEFDKRGRRNQAPVGPPVLHYMHGAPRQLPMPMAQGPRMHMQNRRPPPPRESFRNGPPPQHYQGLPLPHILHTLHRGYAHPQQQRYPPGGPPPGPLPPAQTLLPFSLRPGQPPPPMPPWQQPPPPTRASHLPPRPPVPVGRAGGFDHRDHNANPPHAGYDGHAGYGGAARS